MSRIKIIERDEKIAEFVLTRYERQGLTLISVNTYVVSEWSKSAAAGTNFKHDVTHWVYHFRIGGKKSYTEWE